MEPLLSELPPFGSGPHAAEWPVVLECSSAQPGADRLAQLLREKIDWSVLPILAEEHGVLAALTMRLRLSDAALVPQEVRDKLQERHRAQLIFTLRMTAELFDVLDRLKAAGIETLVIKGPVLSVRAYGDPGWRQYADLDLLVRDADILRATEAMTAAGYEADVPIEAIKAGKIPGEYLFVRPGTKILVELHTERTFRYFPKPLPLEDFFARRTHVKLDARDVPALSAEDELVLICIHGAKHFWERLMWIADVAGFVTRADDLDWERVNHAAQAVGAERMLHVGLALAQEFSAAKLPTALRAEIQKDRGTGELVKRVRTWLPMAGYAPPKLSERAAFRVRMRGGTFAGFHYLLRLSLSPTEEDWSGEAGEKRSWLFDALRRPFRLARKYGKNSEG